MPGAEDLLSANPTGAIVQGGLGVIETAIGLINEAKAKKEAAALAASRPKRTTSPLVGQDLSLAESDLARGLSSRAEAAYNAENNKALSASLDAILKSGGSANNVADVFGASEEGRQRLAILQDNLRLNQVNNVFRARQRAIDQSEENFKFNEWAPWADKAQANAVARDSSNKAIWSGLGMAGAAAINFSNQKDSANAFNAELRSRSMGGGSNNGFFGEHGMNSGRSTTTDYGLGHDNAEPDMSQYQLPDYLNDPLYMTGGHNMFGG